MIVPLKLRAKVLDELHKGHCGIVRMKALSRSYMSGGRGWTRAFPK